MSRSTLPLGSAREREHGQVLVLFAFVLIGLLLVSALAVDYGGWLLARRTYQNFADEAALAGAAQLTSPIGDQCTVSQPSKNHCAREAAWTSIKNATGILSLTPSLQADSIGDTPYTADGYRIWVASPPSDAGAAYTGLASSKKTIFVRVERDLQAGLSRIIKSSATTVGSWATAGRIPENFAILVLCDTGCLGGSGGGSDLQVAGTGSNLILESGDLGSNAYGKTSGTSASIALNDGSDGKDVSLAYMHNPSQCVAGSVSCQIDAWHSATQTVDTSTLYSALALPQVVDPLYQKPTITSTTAGGIVGGTTPWQCYSTNDNPGTFTAAVSEPFANGPRIDGTPVQQASLIQPAPTSVVFSGLATAAGTVTAAVGGAKLGGIKVTLTPGGLNDTTTGAGAYSVKNVPAGTFTLTATDATGTYHTFTTSVTVGASGTVTTNFAMNKNPIITGIVRDTSLTPIVGATVSVTLGATTWTATSGAGGAYSIVAQPPAGAGPWTFSTSATAAGYAGDTPYTVTANVDTTTPNQNHTLTANPGSISGTVSSGGSPLAGVQVTSSTGGSVAITDAAGHYTITGVPAGTTTVTASKTGYSTGTQSVTVPPGGAVVNINFTLLASATVNGTITDDTTGLPLAGATVTVSSGPSSGNTPVTTDATGHYTITGLTAGNYKIAAVATGYTQGISANTSVAGTTTINLALWPSHCGTSNATKGKWDCGYGSEGCPAVTNPTSIDVSCSAFNAANRIRPGTYKSITIASNTCAWIDPVGGAPGITSGQKPGVVYVTDTLSIGSNAFLFGDGVTIVMGTDSHADVNNSGGFVINYEGITGTYLNAWRTTSAIGGTGATVCAGDTLDFRKGAWTTKTRYTWDTSVTPPCFKGNAINPAEIGMTWYMSGPPNVGGGHRFAFSGAMGFLFDGVLYGPKDDIDLGGQGAQAAAGQIVAWTLKYHGDTDIHQRYSGIEVDGPPYLIEPYLGE